ncbi:hypothetical protein [Aeromicrobium sp. 179-A 4D2 NHS]|uniref:hypothetical protein n=1 Tax=Aeromicrobium sp. 179-A 4D2 NHS TaxID=3142375 RepID=UPI0039A1C243
MNRIEKIAASRTLRTFSETVLGPSVDLRDAATCRSIAADAITEADRILAEANETDVFVVTGPGGFTETLDSDTVDLLVRLGFIRHDRDGHVLQDGQGNGIGPLHRFYVQA